MLKYFSSEAEQQQQLVNLKILYEEMIANCRVAIEVPGKLNIAISECSEYSLFDTEAIMRPLLVDLMTVEEIELFNSSMEENLMKLNAVLDFAKLHKYMLGEKKKDPKKESKRQANIEKLKISTAPFMKEMKLNELFHWVPLLTGDKNFSGINDIMLPTAAVRLIQDPDESLPLDGIQTTVHEAAVVKNSMNIQIIAGEFF